MSRTGASMAIHASGTFDVKVHVMSARDLASFDRGGTSDPYVVVSIVDAEGTVLAGMTAKTKSIKKSLAPDWTESFVFRSVPLAKRPHLEFDVYDANAIAADVFMGRVVLPSFVLATLADSIKRLGPTGFSDCVWSQYKRLDFRTKADDTSEPAEDKLQGQLHVILTDPSVEFEKLTPQQQKPPLAPEEDDGESYLSASTAAAPAPRLSLAIDRQNSKEESVKAAPTAAGSASPSSPVAVKVYTADEMKKRAEMRQKVAEEVVTTEASYVKGLSVLMDVFVNPLKKDGVNKYGVSDAQVSNLISNLESIASFHHPFFAELSKPGAVTAAVMLKWVDYMKIYSQYMNGYEKAISVQSELRKNKKFQGFLSEVRTKLSGLGSLDLNSYLIMPVQRIPRYVLLLRELERYTDEKHPEAPTLAAVLAKVQVIATHINEQKKQMENLSKLIEIQNRISGDFNELLQPYRSLVKEGQITLKETTGLFGGVTNEARIFFLFNDVLLWTSVDHNFKGILEVSAMTIEESANGKYAEPFCFELATSEKHLVCVGKDEPERALWIKLIKDAKNVLIEKRQKARQRKLRMKSKQGQYKSLESVHSLISNSLQGLQAHSGGSLSRLSVSGAPPSPTSANHASISVATSSTGSGSGSGDLTPRSVSVHPTTAADVAANVKTLKKPIAGGSGPAILATGSGSGGSGSGGGVSSAPPVRKPTLDGSKPHLMPAPPKGPPPASAAVIPGSPAALAQAAAKPHSPNPNAPAIAPKPVLSAATIAAATATKPSTVPSATATTATPAATTKPATVPPTATAAPAKPTATATATAAAPAAATGPVVKKYVPRVVASRRAAPGTDS